MPIVDCQSHIFSPEFVDILLRSRDFVSAERQDDAIVAHFGDIHSLRIREAEYTPLKKISDMNATGITFSVLSPNIPWPDSLDTKLREPGARACNDYTAQLCRQYPDRFGGLAVLPFSTIDAAMREYTRTIHTMGFLGISLSSHPGGLEIDDPLWEPLYQAAADEGIPLVLHPTVALWESTIHDYSMIPMIGFMADHSFAMLRLILSGVMERHPGLKIVQPHCGGILPYLIPRIDEQTEVKRRGRSHIVRSPSSYYREVFLDIVSPSPDTARFALEFSGAGRLLFGSDHPWITMESMVQVLELMNLAQAEREAIEYKNAAALFGLSLSE